MVVVKCQIALIFHIHDFLMQFYILKSNLNNVLKTEKDH